MTNRLESLVDYGTSAIAGGASGYCCALLATGPIAPVAAGGAGFLAILALMKRIDGRPAHPALASLAPLPLPAFPEDDELLLDDPEELLLDQPAPMAVSEAQARIASAFDALGPSGFVPSDPPAEAAADDSRVVALFGGEVAAPGDPAALKARIDAHLAAQEGQRPSSRTIELVPDASEALAAALKGLGRDTL